MGQPPRLFSISISSPLTPLPHTQNVPKKDCRVGRAAKRQQSIKRVKCVKPSILSTVPRKGGGGGLFIPKSGGQSCSDLLNSTKF
jgi:hypothetical protein